MGAESTKVAARAGEGQSGSARRATGMLARSRVPPPRRAGDREPPVERLDAVLEALGARPARRVGAADAVVGDLDDDLVAVLRLEDLDARHGRVRVLRDVGERLGGDVVRRGLDRRRQPLVGNVDLDGERRPQNERLERGAEPAVGEHVRVEPPCELAELLERAGSSSRARARISVASATSVSIRDSASRRESDSAASRCCAPSWRLRSRRRRAASVASTIRARDARSSSSWRLRSLTSAPEMSTRATPDWSRIGVAVQATSARARPP